MKRTLLAILLALLVLLAPRPFAASALEQDANGARAERPPAPLPRAGEPASEGEDDIFSTTYERELLSRRYFQKSLPPLSRREKIVWSFKTARANVLL